MGKRLDCTIGLGGTQTWILETLEPVLLGPSVGLLEPVGTAEAYWEIGWNNLPRNLPGTPWCICVHTCVSNSPSFLSTEGLLPVGSLAGCAPYLSLTSLIPSPSCQQFSKPSEALQPHPNLGLQPIPAYTVSMEARGKMSKLANDTTPTLSRAGLAILSLTFSKQGCRWEAKCYCKTCLAVASCWISPLLCTAQLLPGGLKSLVLERDSWAKESLQAGRKSYTLFPPPVSVHPHLSSGFLVLHSSGVNV